MSALRWHSTGVGGEHISNDGRFTIRRYGTGHYEMTDRRGEAPIKRSRLKDCKALAERIRIDEQVVAGR